MATKFIFCIACVCVSSFFVNWVMTAAFLLKYKTLIFRLRQTNFKVNMLIEGLKNERQRLFYLLFRVECLNENVGVREFRLSVRRYATLYVCNNVICFGSGFLLMGIGCAISLIGLLWQNKCDKSRCEHALVLFTFVFLIIWGVLMAKFVSFELRVLRILIKRASKIKYASH